MTTRKLVVAVFLFLSSSFHARTQSLTGTWEGDIVDNGEFLQINIVQVGNRLCGYSWDYVYDNENSYCKAYFTGVYDPAKSKCFLEGNTFITNSGGHSLMQMLIQISTDGKRMTMNGLCRLKSGISFLNVDEPSTIRLRKVSNKPFVVTETMKNCVADMKRLAKPAVPPPVKKKPVPEKPKRPETPKKKDPPVIAVPPPVKKDTVPVKLTPPAKVPPVAESLPPQTAGRTNRESQRIPITGNRIQLNIYDNAETDGDSISIYYNGRLVRSHMRLSEKPIVLDLELDPNKTLHSLVLFAENLGAIPPNTALVIFNDAKGKRYELFARADLKQNAMLVFEVKKNSYEPCNLSGLIAVGAHQLIIARIVVPLPSFRIHLKK